MNIYLNNIPRARGYLGEVKGANLWAVATLLQAAGWFITGPLRLVGWSVGGVIAHEIAVQAAARGQGTQLVVRRGIPEEETQPRRQRVIGLLGASGIPVDFFATTEEAWFNYLVCRTGPAELNTRIASAASGASDW